MSIFLGLCLHYVSLLMLSMYTHHLHIFIAMSSFVGPRLIIGYFSSTFRSISIFFHLRNIAMYGILEQIQGFYDSRKDVSGGVEATVDDSVYFWAWNGK